jgi:hypothetical protein
MRSSRVVVARGVEPSQLLDQPSQRTTLKIALSPIITNPQLRDPQLNFDNNNLAFNPLSYILENLFVQIAANDYSVSLLYYCT